MVGKPRDFRTKQLESDPNYRNNWNLTPNIDPHCSPDQQRHNTPMPTQALLQLLQQRLPGLLAVYAFGSRVKLGGTQAQADSDLDLAVLVAGRADPVLLFDLMGELADVAGCPVDLLDLRAASTVMQHQVLTSGEQLWAKDIQADLFAAAMLTEKLWFDARRAPLVQDVMERGSVYGR